MSKTRSQTTHILMVYTSHKNGKSSSHQGDGGSNSWRPPFRAPASQVTAVGARFLAGTPT